MRELQQFGVIAWLQPIDAVFEYAMLPELDQHLAQLVAAGAEGLMLAS